MAEKASKQNIAERGVRFLRDVHIALGAAALTLAAVVPGGAILYPLAAYEGLNAGAHEGLRQIVKTRQKKK